MPELASLLQWLPQGGAAAAVIIVVWMFLKQQDKMAELMIQVTNTFTNALETDRTRSEVAHREMQEQVNDLVKDQIVSNTQMAEAIRGLQAAVSDLQRKD